MPHQSALSKSSLVSVWQHDHIASELLHFSLRSQRLPPAQLACHSQTAMPSSWPNKLKVSRGLFSEKILCQIPDSHNCLGAATDWPCKAMRTLLSMSNVVVDASRKLLSSVTWLSIVSLTNWRLKLIRLPLFRFRLLVWLTANIRRRNAREIFIVFTNAKEFTKWQFSTGTTTIIHDKNHPCQEVLPLPLNTKRGNPPTHTLSQNAYEQRIHKWTSSTQKTQGGDTEHQPKSFV